MTEPNNELDGGALRILHHILANTARSFEESSNIADQNTSQHITTDPILENHRLISRTNRTCQLPREPRNQPGVVHVLGPGSFPRNNQHNRNSTNSLQQAEVIPVVDSAFTIEIVDGTLEKCIDLHNRRTQALIAVLLSLFLGLVIAIIAVAMLKNNPLTKSASYREKHSVYDSTHSSQNGHDLDNLSVNSSTPSKTISAVISLSPTIFFSDSPSAAPTLRTWTRIYSTTDDGQDGSKTSAVMNGRLSGNGVFIMISQIFHSSYTPSSTEIPTSYRVLQWTLEKGWISVFNMTIAKYERISEAISFDRSVVVVGLPFVSSGRIYQRYGSGYDEKNQGWYEVRTQKNSTNITSDPKGIALLSGDATRLAISQIDALDNKGRVLLYDYRDDNETWSLTSDLDGREWTFANDTYFGISLQLSKDGFTMAVGSLAGLGAVEHIHVLRYNELESSWFKSQQCIERKQHTNSLTLSDDGRIIALVENHIIGDELTLVYQYNQTSKRYDKIIESPKKSISSLSGDGKRVALTSSDMVREGIKVYNINERKLVQVGSSIVPCQTDHTVCFITSLSLSHDGQRIAVTGFIRILVNAMVARKECFVNVYKI